MAKLIWQSQTRYYSAKDEASFFNWLESIPGVVSVKGIGTQLHITLRSRKLSASSERELRALYHRYRGHIIELEEFLLANSSEKSGSA